MQTMLHLFVQQVMLWQSRAIKNILQLVSDINWWFAIVKIHQNQLKARYIYFAPLRKPIDCSNSIAKT